MIRTLRVGGAPMRARGWVAVRLRSGCRPLLPHSAHLCHRGIQIRQPLTLVLGDESDAPCHRVRARAGHARLDQRVQDEPLRLGQPGHHRYGQPGEDLRRLPAGGPPGDLAPGARLELPGHGDAGVPGLLAEPADASGTALSRVGVGNWDVADDRDLLAVPDNRERLEPVVGQAAFEPTVDLPM